MSSDLKEQEEQEERNSVFMRIPKHIQFLGWNLDHKALELNNEGTRKVMIAKDMVKSVICCKVWFRKLHVSDYCV